MVVTVLPATSFIAVTQLRIAAPFTWTVHAPHWATPHPYFVPVSSATSRRYHSSGISGSPSNCRVAPLTLRLIIQPPWELSSKLAFLAAAYAAAQVSELTGTPLTMVLPLRKNRGRGRTEAGF